MLWIVDFLLPSSAAISARDRPSSLSLRIWSIETDTDDCLPRDDEAFTERGTIKPEYLEKAKERAEAQHNRSLVDAIDLAMRLNALRQHNVQSQ